LIMIVIINCEVGVDHGRPRRRRRGLMNLI